MDRNDLVIDFETMGTNAQKCAAVDCSTIVFNWNRFTENPYRFQELLEDAVRFKFDVADQVRTYGFEVEKDTLAFWNSQPKEVKEKIKPTEGDLTVEEFASVFVQYLKGQPKIEYWWARNTTFDPTVLWRLMWTQQSKYTINEYLMHWRVRDIKTWVDAKFDFTTRNAFVPVSDVEYWNETFKEHDSTHDAAADVMRLQAIYRAENDMEQVER